MKKLCVIISLIVAACSEVCFSQLIPNGSFENGILPAPSPGFDVTLDPAVALPNWSISGSPLYFQGFPLGGPVVGIETTPTSSHGTNSVYLQAGFGGATDPVSLWQILSIPINIKTITFQSKESYDPNLYPAGYYLALLVSAAGVSVTPSYLSTDASGFKTFGIDVVPYQGTSTELRFSVDPLGNPSRGGAYQIDNIRYSSNPVPEPTTLALLGIGFVATFLLRLRNVIISTGYKPATNRITTESAPLQQIC